MRDAVGQACNKARLALGITEPITPHSLRRAEEGAQRQL